MKSPVGGLTNETDEIQLLQKAADKLWTLGVKGDIDAAELRQRIKARLRSKHENKQAPNRRMSLRDYFAAKALTGMLASGGEWDGSNDSHIALTRTARFATAAYSFSDAMLDARK